LSNTNESGTIHILQNFLKLNKALLKDNKEAGGTSVIFQVLNSNKKYLKMKKDTKSYKYPRLK
jgi:hypothetical protein